MLVVPGYFYDKYKKCTGVEVYLEFRVSKTREDGKWYQTTAVEFRACGSAVETSTDIVPELAQAEWDKIKKECEAQLPEVWKPEYCGLVIIRKRAERYNFQPE